MEFKSADPYVSVDLRTHGGEVHASSESDVAARGMADQIRSVLERAKRRRTLVALIAEYGVFVAIGLVLNMYFYAAVQDNDAVTIAALALTAVVAPWAYVSYKRSLSRPQHMIHLQPRSDHPGFFERNKDQLILNSMSAVVGGVVGWLLRGA